LPNIREGFGTSAAVAKDLVAIGAVTETGDPGQACLYNIASADSSVPKVRFQAPGTTTKQFGNAVAIIGTRVAVADAQIGAGAVYVYNLSSESPHLASLTLQIPGTSQAASFGNSLSASDSLLVVGAPTYASGTTGGRVYVYDLYGTSPATPVLVLDNPRPAANARFGQSVAISGRKIVVSSLSELVGGRRGAAHVYDLDSSTPTVPVVTLRNPVVNESTIYGNAVTASGAFVAVGATFDRASEGQSGSVYLYDLNSTDPATSIARLKAPADQPAVRFGQKLAMVGSRLLVSADDAGEVKCISSTFPKARHLCEFSRTRPLISNQSPRVLSLPMALDLEWLTTARQLWLGRHSTTHSD
jgi:hypothetical protein